jgi:hypothetical protein
MINATSEAGSAHQLYRVARLQPDRGNWYGRYHCQSRCISETVPRQQLLHQVERPPNRDRIHDGHDQPAAGHQTRYGNPGEASTNEAESILTTNNNSLVNNSYTAPEVEGCGGIFAFLIDPIVDSKLSLPSAAGKNTAILKGKLQVAEAATVKASE